MNQAMRGVVRFDGEQDSVNDFKCKNMAQILDYPAQSP